MLAFNAYLRFDGHVSWTPLRCFIFTTGRKARGSLQAMFVLKPTTSPQWTRVLRMPGRFIGTYSNVVTDMTSRGLVANVTR